jgi:gamma-glutamylcyclotransferase (GGCT)/AIG2-like uncharacterized protein YtfP
MKIGDRVFVYGTLRPGQHNHKWAKGAVHIGPAMMPGLVMYDLGGFPAVLKGNGDVYGDLLEITDEEQVRSMDQLEGHPTFYCREEMFTDKGTAWVYIFKDEGIKRRKELVLPTGDWVKRWGISGA